jgi:TPR repeat protein
MPDKRRLTIAVACATLFVVAGAGAQVPEVTSPAERAEMKQACDDGNGAGCNALGFVFAKGRGVPKNIAAANGLFRRSATPGDASTSACLTKTEMA